MKILFLELMLFCISSLHVCKEICPNNMKGELRFTTKKNEVVFAYLGHYKSLDCCATGYDILLWYHQKRGDNSWKQFPFSVKGGRSPSLISQNQTLSLLEVLPGTEGTFKCIARNFTSVHKQEISFSFHLIIDDSHSHNEVIPNAPPEYVCIENSTVTISCWADFGFNGGVTDVNIYPFGTNSVKFSRILKHYWDDDDKTVKGCNVTLVNATRQDIGTVFQCDIYSDRSNSIYFNTTIQDSHFCNPEYYPGSRVKVLIAVIPSLVFVILFLSALGLCRYRLHVILRSHFPRPYNKIYGGISPMLGDKKYHAFIHCCDGDTELASHIFSDIKNCASGYNLCVSADASAGLHFRSIGELAKQAATFIIIHPTKVTWPNAKPFFREVNAILETNFKDQKNTVNVVCHESTWGGKIADELKGYYRLEAGKSQCWWRWSRLQELQLRMPLPLVDKNRNSNNGISKLSKFKRHGEYDLIMDQRGSACHPTNCLDI